MVHLLFTKRVILAILTGVCVSICIGILISVIGFSFNIYIARIYSVENYQSTFYEQPHITITWLLKLLGFISLMAGGFLTSRIIKKSGFLYGASVGVVLVLLSISLASLAFILPAFSLYGPHYSADLAQQFVTKNILNQLLRAPLTIVLTAFGGYLGEKLYGRKLTKK